MPYHCTLVIMKHSGVKTAMWVLQLMVAVREASGSVDPPNGDQELMRWSQLRYSTSTTHSST